MDLYNCMCAIGMLARADTCLSDGTTGRAKVTPLGGTRMLIPVSGTQAALQRSDAWTYTIVCAQWACLHEQTHVYRTGQQGRATGRQPGLQIQEFIA